MYSLFAGLSDTCVVTVLGGKSEPSLLITPKPILSPNTQYKKRIDDQVIMFNMMNSLTGHWSVYKEPSDTIASTVMQASANGKKFVIRVPVNEFIEPGKYYITCTANNMGESEKSEVIIKETDKTTLK